MQWFAANDFIYLVKKRALEKDYLFCGRKLLFMEVLCVDFIIYGKIIFIGVIDEGFSVVRDSIHAIELDSPHAKPST